DRGPEPRRVALRYRKFDRRTHWPDFVHRNTWCSIKYTNGKFMKGKFIVIEGGDGAGKDTQIELLKKDFPDFVYTREPGGTPLGKVLREMVLHKSYGELPLLTEAFLFLADRAQHA